MSRKLERHPICSTNITRGVVATIFPIDPMATKIPASEAKIRGLNHKVKSLYDPIKLQAIPTPSSARPAAPITNESAQEKITAPTTPIIERTVIMLLGPNLSSNRLMGIWVRANA